MTFAEGCKHWMKYNRVTCKAFILKNKIQSAKWEKNGKLSDAAALQQLFAKRELLLQSPDRTFYVIIRPIKVGLFSYVETTLGQVKYALEHDMIPIVDFMNYPNSYIPDEKQGKVNAWELFFENLCPVPLSEVYANEKYVLCRNENASETAGNGGFFKLRVRWYWQQYYKEFIKLSPDAAEYVRKDFEHLFPNGTERVLGVAVRGTDYKTAKGHPIQPSVDELIRRAGKLLAGGYYDRLYVKSEELRVVNMFREAFPGKVVAMESGYYDEFEFKGQNIATSSFERENDEYLRGLEYLSTIWILAHCDGILCGLNGGTNAALYLNGGDYRDVICIYKGFSNWDDRSGDRAPKGN